eukprot:8968640-Pyramimonas_sp.AAC.1
MPKLYTTDTRSPPPDVVPPEAIGGWQVGQSASSTTVSQSVVSLCRLQGILLRSFIQCDSNRPLGVDYERSTYVGPPGQR